MFADDTIIGTHGTEANPRLCATCHVNRMTVTDLATGDFVFQASGHLFQAAPCLDASGIPTRETDCNTSERSFSACSISGCHASPDQASAAFIAATTRIDGLVATLNGLLGSVPSSEFDATDNVLSVAEGAKFNADLAGLRGSAIHNPFLLEALLNASIQEVMSKYPTPTPDP